jgi:hypothetical protein
MKKHELKKFRETYTLWDDDRTVLSKGLQLACHYDEREDVKRIGGMWNPDEKTWWMPAKCLDNTCSIPDEEYWGDGGSGTVLDWLNNHKMVQGEYGNIDPQGAKSAVENVEPDITAKLTNYTSDEDDIGVNFYKEMDLVEFVTSDSFGTTNFKTAAEGRIHWDELIKKGYTHV